MSIFVIIGMFLLIGATVTAFVADYSDCDSVLGLAVLLSMAILLQLLWPKKVRK